MRDEFNRNQNAAFKAQRVSKGNCIMGFVPIGGQPPIPIVEHDGQKSPISDKIEQITKATENLYLPNCMYQALRTEPLRLAFSAHNRKEVFKTFLEISAGERINPKNGKPIDRKKEGYFPQDVTRYLNFLKANIYTSQELPFHATSRARPLDTFRQSVHKACSSGRKSNRVLRAYIAFGRETENDQALRGSSQVSLQREVLCALVGGEAEDRSGAGHDQVLQ